MRKITILSASSLLAMAGNSAWAQTQPTAAADTLEEIVVTAEKREVNLQKTSISIQVTSGEELRKQGKKRIEEIMDGVVGVQAQGAEVGASFYMRGVGNDRGQAGGFGSGPTQSAVAIMVDGVYQGARESISSGTLDLAQAEVMRGPQSTTLGGSSLAGALSLVSNKPVFEYQGFGTLEAGNYDKLGLEGVFNAPISSNQALRIAASTEKRDGYISSGLGNSDLFNARLKYRWQASDDLDIVLTVARNKVGGAPVTLGGLSYSGYHTAYGNCIVAGGTQNCDGNYRGFPITYAHVENNVTYKNRSNPWDDGMPSNGWGHEPMQHYANTAYSANIDWTTPVGKLSVVPSVQNGTLLTAESGITDFYVVEDNKYTTRQIDVNFSSNPGSWLTWLVGYNYYYTNTTGLDSFVVAPGTTAGPGVPPGGCPGTYDNDNNPLTPNVISPKGCYAWTGIGESSQTTNGLYGNASLPVTDSFRVIGGLRYTKDTKGAQGTYGETAGTINAPGPGFIYGPKQTYDWSKTTYRAGVEYDVAPESMAYATYSTGYQPGAIQWNGMTGTFATTQSQTLNQITVGIKNRFFDNTLQFNIEAFDSTYHNRGQSGAITGGNATDPACIAAAAAGMGALLAANNYSCVIVGGLTVPNLKSRGADIELNWMPTGADRFDFNLEYLKATQSSPAASSAVTALAIEQAVLGCGGMGPACPVGLVPSAGSITLLGKYNERVGVYDGATLSSSPKFSGNVSYRHDFAFPGGSRLSPMVNVAYKSSYWTSFNLPAPYSPQSPGPAGQDAYAIYNFNLNWLSQDGKLSVTGYVKNIENTPVLLNFEGGGFRGAADVSLGDPRTFGLITTVSF